MHNKNTVYVNPLVPQDLHIHSLYSKGDSSIVPEQTPSLIARFRHAVIQGISDHLEGFNTEKEFEDYLNEASVHGFIPGIEVNGAGAVAEALRREVEYFIYHCRDRTEDYRGAEKLLGSGKPVIIAHPCLFNTQLSRVPDKCHIEINNRYVWKGDWHQFYGPFTETKTFVFGSDAHQPNWLNQNIARRAGKELGIREQLLFPDYPAPNLSPPDFSARDPHKSMVRK